MSDPLKDFNARLDAALAPALQGAADRVKAKKIRSAAKTGGKKAAKKVAQEMTPEQAERVLRHL
jgi:hypothetical protein